MRIFQYGKDFFVETTTEDLANGDIVYWTPQESRNCTLRGKIVFIGEDHKTKGAIYAIVQFTVTTCHLPGHIASPPSKRNLVNVSSLEKKDLENVDPNELCWDYSRNLEIVGNCEALTRGFKQTEALNIPLKTVLSIKVAGSSSQMATVLATGWLGTSKNISVGVRLDKPLPTTLKDVSFNFAPNHISGTRCKNCKDGTFIFIPHDAIAKRNHASISIDFAKIACPISETYILNRGDRPFIGNCVVLNVGFQPQKVPGVKLEQVVMVNCSGKTLRGKIKLVCKINEVDERLNYVGIRFEGSFSKLCNCFPDIQHTKIFGESDDCEGCLNGNLVHVPTGLLPIDGTCYQKYDNVSFTFMH